MIRMLYNEEVALRWGEFSPLVESAILKGSGRLDTTPHGLLLEVLKGYGQCWVYEVEGELRSVAITRVEFSENHRELCIVTTTGEGWGEYGPEALEIIESFAKKADCKYVSMYGRKGWLRQMPSEYKQPYIIMKKEV